MWGIKPKEFHKLKRFKEFFKYNTQQHQEELVFDEEEKSVLDWLIIRHQGWPWKVWSMLVLARNCQRLHLCFLLCIQRERV